MDATQAPPPTRAPRAIARIEHSEALLAVLRRRLDELQLTHEMVDTLAGFALGYTSKLLANPPIKRLGHFSQFVLLETLGLDMILCENPAAAEALKNPKLKRRQAWVLRRPSIQVWTPDKLRVNGRKGARVRNVKLSERRRSAIARRAAKARWAKHRRNGRDALAAAASPPAPASP